jgi:nucleotide-binding universal stress UspA family protein
MFQRILVAIDGSPTSQSALTHAIRVARDDAAALRIVHVVDLDPQAEEISDSAEYEDALRRDAGSLLKEAEDQAARLSVSAETAQLERLALQDDIGGQILAEAQRWGADLQFLATHGRRGVRRILLGSVAESVARRSSVPVLLVPAHDGNG